MSEEPGKAQPRVCAGIEMSGAVMIFDERQRQINLKGYLADHDDGHAQAEIAEAGISYAMVAVLQVKGAEDGKQAFLDDDHKRWWPWDDDSFNPKQDPVENLVRAGALIAAEIDRLLRLRAQTGGKV